MDFNIRIFDYDLVGKDEVMCEYDIKLEKDDEEAEFLRDSSQAFSKVIRMLAPRKKGVTNRKENGRGELHLSLQYTPFFNAGGVEADAEDPAKAMEALAVRFFNTTV
jgi:hypothetical protein